MPTRLAVIITALPLEREAVQQHIRNVREEPEHRGSIYRRGIFDELSEPWDVVVAEIGAGNTNAAAEVVRIIDHYSPQVALFVGIAGALKDLKHGDVVASTKVYQYDSGKDEEEFRSRPAIQLSDYGLEKRAQYEAGEPHWRQRIKGESPPEAAEPTAVTAAIAAGEKVVGSNLSHSYKLIRKHCNDALAVEMEGHGFLLGVRMSNGTQGIVVRGISDLVDDKNADNDKKWQPVAARHAAAFAFQLLAKLLPMEGKAEAAASLVQNLDLGGISGSYNTVNVHQQQGFSLEDMRRVVQTSVTDANAEIDVANAHLDAGKLEIAIHLLEDLRKKRWDILSPREKYRLAAGMGHAMERSGEFKKAALYFMEAKQHQPHDEKARAYEAIAHIHVGDKAKAYELAGNILSEFPNCSLAIAIRIRSSPSDVALSALEAIIPVALENDLEIVHAMGWRALALGDLAAANKFVDIALKHNPERFEVLEQQAVVILQQEGRAKHAGRSVNTSRLELAVENLTLGIMKHRSRLDEAKLRYNRAEANDLLGKTEDAETDFRAAIDTNDESTDFVRRFVLFLERHGRTDAAIDTLLQSDKFKRDHYNRLLLCDLLNARKGKGDVELAISILQEIIAEQPELEIRTEVVDLLIHLLGSQNEHVRAFSILDGLDNAFLSPAVFNAIRAKAHMKAGQKDEAESCAVCGSEALMTDSSIIERMRVAESLTFVGKKQEALKLWKEILKPDHIDRSVCMALELARETGDDTFIMSFCNQLREAGATTPYTLELEVVTLEKYGVFPKAIEVMKSYLTETSDTELAKVFRLRLSLLGIRLEKPELVECDPTMLPLVESAPVKIGAATAQVLHCGPRPELGGHYAYELVRRNFNDYTARVAYVGILGMGDDKHHFPDIFEVVPGCAVKYRADDTGEEKWLIVEDSPNPNTEREEYGPDHVWVKEMAGQSVGGQFHLRRDELQPRTATITGLLNKYVYRKFEIIDGWEQRFPGEDKSFFRKYTFPTNPDGTPDITLILKSLDLRVKQIEEMHDLYRDNPISATTFARFTDAGLLESMSHIASEGTLPIRCCWGHEAELSQAESALSGAETFVLDPTALATLFFCDQYEQLKLLAGKIVICESALGGYADLLRKFRSSSQGFLGKFNGKYVFREDDPAEREGQQQRFETFLSKIKPLVTMKTGESLARIPPEARKELIGLFGEATAQAMAEAAVTGAVLWTDDLVVAEVGKERIGIVKRVWTQLVMRSVAAPDVHEKLTLFLLRWRYFFTIVDPEVVVAACRDGSWDVDAPVIKNVADWLNHPELMNLGAVNVCAQSLRLIWKHGPDVGHKQGVAKLFLKAVRRRKDGRQNLTVIQNILGTIFTGEKAARTECEAVINEVQKAERTPGEIATAKRDTTKMLTQFQRRIGVPHVGGREQTERKNIRQKNLDLPRSEQKKRQGNRKRK